MTDTMYTRLPDRAIIRMDGADRHDFLQGLITQDIRLLEKQNMVYACLLTPQGKFLYDFFIFENDGMICIDCEGGARAQALLKILSRYKLRKNITMALDDDVDVYQFFEGKCVGQICYKDPRHDACGYRMYQKPVTGAEVDFSRWDERRIRAEIPDGSRDLISEKSFIHEGRLDDFHAVSYDKGCYMGQELVSRMHHRGLTKKRLQCVDLDNIPDGADMRSTSGNLGLAVVRVV